MCATIGLLTTGTTACGGSSVAARTSSSTAETTPHQLDGDNDIDTLGSGPDYDNDAVLGYGPPADTADRRVIVSLLKRYYAVAAAGDGAKACSMLDPLVAEEIVEEHHNGKGPSSLRGSTCAQIISKLFKRHHRELAKDVAEFRVTTMELRGNRGLVLMPYSTANETQVIVRRDNGVWRMDEPIDNGAQ